MWGLIPFLGGLAARFLGGSVLRWLAWKAAILFVTTVIIPIVVNNIMYKIIEKSMGLVSGQMQNLNLPSSALAFVGIGAWLAVTLKVPEAISVVMGAVSYRVGLQFIPFFRGR